MKQNITYKYYKTQHTNTLIIDILKWNKTSHNTYNMILTNNVIQHLGKRWRRATTLIIDEVSMLSGDTFDKLEVLARLVRRSGIFFFRFTKSSPQRCFWQVDSWSFVFSTSCLVSTFCLVLSFCMVSILCLVSSFCLGSTFCLVSSLCLVSTFWLVSNFCWVSSLCLVGV